MSFALAAPAVSEPRRRKVSPKPEAFQFATPPQGTFTGAAVADYDRDGWLDIYFCLYVYYQGTEQYKYPSPYYDAENGPPNFMMRNNRDGTFRDVTAHPASTRTTPVTASAAAGAIATATAGQTFTS